ncbi:MAG: transposase [Nostoc sp.]|uniref:transposase n=1 Tax=Nostoc sp. TaxID=1180 RepID=UPI002FFD4B93
MIVSEIGVDMSRFPSASHLAAWAGLAPGNYESVGKRLSGKTRKGNQTLRSGLMQSAHVASRSRTYLAAQYRRVATRRGKKRATMAVAHSILVIAYHIIQRHEPYRELGVNYFDQQRPETMTKRLVKRLEQLGHRVTLNLNPLLKLLAAVRFSSQHHQCNCVNFITKCKLLFPNVELYLVL